MSDARAKATHFWVKRIFIYLFVYMSLGRYWHFWAGRLITFYVYFLCFTSPEFGNLHHNNSTPPPFLINAIQPWNPISFRLLLFHYYHPCIDMLQGVVLLILALLVSANCKLRLALQLGEFLRDKQFTTRNCLHRPDPSAFHLRFWTHCWS